MISRVICLLSWPPPKPWLWPLCMQPSNSSTKQHPGYCLRVNMYINFQNLLARHRKWQRSSINKNISKAVSADINTLKNRKAGLKGWLPMPVQFSHCLCSTLICSDSGSSPDIIISPASQRVPPSLPLSFPSLTISTFFKWWLLVKGSLFFMTSILSEWPRALSLQKILWIFKNIHSLSVYTVYL